MMKLIGIFAAAMLVIGCNKNKPQSTLSVKMTDAPGDFQEVNVDVIRVDLHYAKSGVGDDGWWSLPTEPGVYDLLKLQNDVTAVLTDQGEIPDGKVTQMRLILGGNNTVMVDSVIHQLETPSAENSGLKFNLKTEFEKNKKYEVIIDFDAQQSIVEKGNGGYSLKPVIKIKDIKEL